MGGTEHPGQYMGLTSAGAHQIHFRSVYSKIREPYLRASMVNLIHFDAQLASLRAGINFAHRTAKRRSLTALQLHRA